MSSYKYYEDDDERAIRTGYIPKKSEEGLSTPPNQGSGARLDAKAQAAVQYGCVTAQNLTGGSSSYYKVHINNPTTLPAPYDAECNDIIEALQMNFTEGNIFKAIWRMAASRIGNGKPGNTYLYDAEKVQFFADRLLTQAKG